MEEEIAGYEKEAGSIWRKFVETTEKIRILKEIRMTLSRQGQLDYVLTAEELKVGLGEARQAVGNEPPRCRKVQDRWKARVDRNGIFVDDHWVNSFQLSKYRGTCLIVQRNECGIDLFTMAGRYLFSIDIPTSQELDWSEAIKRMQANQKG